jgi:hypothetical protein
MFQTVRHWWGGGSGKVTARLFLFELSVVVVGVLLAQTVASYAQTRSDFARMESERFRVRDELTTVHSALRTWQAAVPCLDRRMTEVMQGTQLETDSMRRPRFPTFGYAPPTTEIMDLVGKRYGVTEKSRLNWIAENSGNGSPVIASMISKWGRLMLVDPSNGTVSASDRREARLAAADIKAQLRAMEVLSKDAVKILVKMGIGARNQNEPDYGPARTCAAIWASGRLDPPLTMQ